MSEGRSPRAAAPFGVRGLQEPADEFEEEPESHQEWARESAKTLRGQAVALHAHSWPTAARGPADARVRDFDRAAAHWDAAAEAEDSDAFWDHWDKAEQALAMPNDVQLRGALGLAIAPPREPADSGDLGEEPGGAEDATWTA